jgi:hypothetical protein
MLRELERVLGVVHDRGSNGGRIEIEGTSQGYQTGDSLFGLLGVKDCHSGRMEQIGSSGRKNRLVY